jgi:hypothetical protein
MKSNIQNMENSWIGLALSIFFLVLCGIAGYHEDIQKEILYALLCLFNLIYSMAFFVVNTVRSSKAPDVQGSDTTDGDSSTKLST